MPSFNFKKIDNPAKDNLEQALQRAIMQPNYWPAFYEKLLSEDVYVLTRNDELPAGSQILAKDTEVQIAALKDGRIPVFTAEERIFDGNIIKNEVKFMALQGRALLSIIKDAGLILNPYSDFLKELLPEEIAALIAEDYELGIERKPPATNIQIGQPALYPTDIVTALSRLFTERTQVKAAYLGWIYNPPKGELPHYIFAIDAHEEDFAKLTAEAGFVAAQWLLKNEVIDFIKIKNGEQFSRYFLEKTEPFYSKH